ncbi:hypothetical protein ACWDAZ_26010, partial [Streptomyces sp. NPDC001215]
PRARRRRRSPRGCCRSRRSSRRAGTGCICPGTLDKTAAAKLPQVTGTPSFPTEAQQSKAKTAIAQGWGKAVSG